MKSYHYLNDIDEKLNAVSHPIRLEILSTLYLNGRLTVSELQDLLDMKQPVLSHHLAKMREQGILVATRKGTYVYYHIGYKHIAKLIEFLHEERKEESEH